MLQYFFLGKGGAAFEAKSILYHFHTLRSGPAYSQKEERTGSHMYLYIYIYIYIYIYVRTICTCPCRSIYTCT
jgi:hypothetical protein